MFDINLEGNKHDKLNVLLDWLEEHIDLGHTSKVEKAHVRALEYQQMETLPLSVIYPVEQGIVPYPYSEAFYDPEKMLYNELVLSFNSILNSVRLKDYFPLHIRSNHGIGIIASMFGAEIKLIEDNMPWVEPLGDIKKIEKAINGGVPDFNSGLGKKVIETHAFYLDKLKQYPKCSKAIHISQPDLQGPFDIAHLLMGTDIYYRLYDGSKIIHELLDVITETYIGFRKYIDGQLTDRAGDDCMYVHGAIYKGKVVLKDDTAAVNLSQEMYDEFSGQYNEKILAAFGGGSLHYCGPQRPWHYESMKSGHLKAVNYGNPEMHDIASSYQHWSKYKIPIIWFGYNQGREFLNEIYKAEIPTGMSLAVKAKDFDEAQEIMKIHVKD